MPDATRNKHIAVIAVCCRWSGRARTLRAQTETLQEEVIDQLRSKINEINETKKLMKDRDAILLDYNAYLRNVRTLKSKGDKGDKLAAVSPVGGVVHTGAVARYPARAVRHTGTCVEHGPMCVKRGWGERWDMALT